MIRDQGPELAKVYPICAIHPGQKRPIGAAWQENPLLPELCESYPEDAGIGILCGMPGQTVYALDFDIMGDEAFAEEMRAKAFEILDGESSRYRVGMYPKFLIPVRGDVPNRLKVTSPYYVKGLNKSRLEILGKGQQFVAVGIHPTTHRPYEWHGEGFFTDELHPVDDHELLPYLSDEAMQEILKAFDELAIKHGWVKDSDEPVGDSLVVATADSLVPQSRMLITLEQAWELIKDAPNVDDRQSWMNVGMALHYEFAGTENEEGAKDLWDRWASQSSKFDADDSQRVWDSFGAFRGAKRTMRSYQWEYNKTHRNKEQEMSEKGRTFRMLEFFRGTIRFAIDTQKWYEWTGFRWFQVPPLVIAAKAARICDDILADDIRDYASGDSKLADQWMKFYMRAQSSRFVDLVVKGAQQAEVAHCRSDIFDAETRYLGVANGEIDLETMQFGPGDQRHFVSHACSVTYDAAATCPVWEQTLKDIFFGDEQMVKFLQRLFGYALTGKANEHKFVVFYGQGGNGKSTVMNTVSEILADYAHTASADMVTSRGKLISSAGAARPDLIALRGHRLVMIPESENGATLREETVKLLAGEDKISARGLYEGVSTFRPTWLTILATNHRPDVKSNDKGIWRRMMLVGFNRDFENDTTIKKDVNRAAALKAEYPGILNWMLDGLREYRRIGLAVPPSVTNATNAYRLDSDFASAWLEERCELDKDFFVSSAVAWADFNSWAAANGVEVLCKSSRGLFHMLEPRGIKSRLIKVGGTPRRCYVGLRIRPADLTGGEE